MPVDTANLQAFMGRAVTDLGPAMSVPEFLLSGSADIGRSRAWVR